MDTSQHDLPALFAQLGLPNDTDSMQGFIASHELPPGIRLSQASFWTPSQADFLKDALDEDAEWAEAADEMAALLSTPQGKPH